VPTDITRNFFFPELKLEQAKPVLDHAIPLLIEIRNYGLNVFLRCQQDAKGGDEDLAILLPYLHFLEMLDGFTVLIGQAVEVPSRLQLRAMLEALLTTEYITQSDTIRRAHAYLVADIIRRKEWCLRCDPQTKQGQGFKKALEEDPDLGGMRVPLLLGLADQLRNLDELFAKEDYREALSEYERLSGPKKRYVNWFELFGGPGSVRKLAIKLKHRGIYEVLYGGWSAVGHGVETVKRQLVSTDRGEPAVRGLRDPIRIVAAVNAGVSLTMKATRCVLGHYRPGELDRPHRQWYLREVKPLWDKVRQH
jgi:hypothetical protein